MTRIFFHSNLPLITNKVSDILVLMQPLVLEIIKNIVENGMIRNVLEMVFSLKTTKHSQNIQLYHNSALIDNVYYKFCFSLFIMFVYFMIHLPILAKSPYVSRILKIKITHVNVC